MSLAIIDQQTLDTNIIEMYWRNWCPFPLFDQWDSIQEHVISVKSSSICSINDAHPLSTFFMGLDPRSMYTAFVRSLWDWILVCTRPCLCPLFKSILSYGINRRQSLSCFLPMIDFIMILLEKCISFTLFVVF